jgi:phosphatidyl-myo-inositol dimannoside synthase
MHVLMLNNEYPPLGGGTGSVNQAILSALAHSSELNVDLITSSATSRSEELRPSSTIRIIRLAIGSRNLHHATNRELMTYGARALWRALRLHRARPYDLCLAFSALPAGVVALGLRRLTGLRYIVRVCGPDIPGFEQRYTTVYRILGPLIRAVWLGAEVVIAKSDGERAMIRRIEPEAHVQIIENAVDLMAFSPVGPIPDDGPLRLLCVARLIERKGQQHLLEAMNLVVKEGVEVALTLVGTGDAERERQEQAARLGLTDRVHFAGYVPREEIAAWYRAAHAFVLPSYNEGMSVATLEAMAAGLPILSSRAPGQSELVVDGVNGFTCEWDDVESLAAHIRRLAADRPLARQMGAASRNQASRFTWESVTSRYLQLFTALAPQVSRSSPERGAALTGGG